MPTGTPPPRFCPACDAELYPVARLRPRAGLSPLAKGLMAIGMALSAAVFLGGMAWSIYRRDVFIHDHPGRVRPGGGLMGIVFMIPALIPGLTLGWLAYRLPKALALRCPKCSWRERYRLTADGDATPASGIASRPTTAHRRPDPRAAALAQVTTAPPRAPAVAVDQFCEDDRTPVERARSWIRCEFVGGRLPEDIAADLVASGWSEEAAEQLVEIGRQETRHLRR